MKALSREQFTSIIKAQRVKPRLIRELRFVPENIENWTSLDFVAVSTRSNAEGLLLIETSDFYILPYELTVGLKDKATGRSKPITCDLCYTWQQGVKAGRITFRRPSDDHTFTYLCCADLQCSLHVRNLTPESILSRAQLHEDISVDQRIARLKTKLNDILETLGIQPAATPLQTFLDSFDCNFPYDDKDKAMAIIKEARTFPSEGIFAVIDELGRPPGRKTDRPDPARRLELLKVAALGFEHPLKDLIVGTAERLIKDDELSVEEAVLGMQEVSRYPNEHTALSILYFSCNDKDDIVDNLYKEIEAKWSTAKAN